MPYSSRPLWGFCFLFKLCSPAPTTVGWLNGEWEDFAFFINYITKVFRFLRAQAWMQEMKEKAREEEGVRILFPQSLVIHTFISHFKTVGKWGFESRDPVGSDRIERRRGSGRVGPVRSLNPSFNSFQEFRKRSSSRANRRKSPPVLLSESAESEVKSVPLLYTSSNLVPFGVDIFIVRLVTDGARTRIGDDFDS